MRFRSDEEVFLSVVARPAAREPKRPSLLFLSWGPQHSVEKLAPRLHAGSTQEALLRFAESHGNPQPRPLKQNLQCGFDLAATWPGARPGLPWSPWHTRCSGIHQHQGVWGQSLGLQVSPLLLHCALAPQVGSSHGPLLCNQASVQSARSAARSPTDRTA